MGTLLTLSLRAISESKRSRAFELDWSSNCYFSFRDFSRSFRSFYSVYLSLNRGRWSMAFIWIYSVYFSLLRLSSSLNTITSSNFRSFSFLVFLTVLWPWFRERSPPPSFLSVSLPNDLKPESAALVVWGILLAESICMLSSTKDPSWGRSIFYSKLAV
jgi:hypothetical protein